MTKLSSLSPRHVFFRSFVSGMIAGWVGWLISNVRAFVPGFISIRLFPDFGCAGQTESDVLARWFCHEPFCLMPYLDHLLWHPQGQALKQFNYKLRTSSMWNSDCVMQQRPSKEWRRRWGSLKKNHFLNWLEITYRIVAKITWKYFFFTIYFAMKASSLSYEIKRNTNSWNAFVLHIGVGHSACFCYQTFPFCSGPYMSTFFVLPHYSLRPFDQHRRRFPPQQLHALAGVLWWMSCGQTWTICCNICQALAVWQF